MTELTDLCKNDFIEWYKNRISVLSFGSLVFTKDKMLLYAVIIEFLDSIGYHFNIYPHLGGGQVVYYPSFVYFDEKKQSNEKHLLFDNSEQYYCLTRQEATAELIKKANEMYNKKNTK